MLTLVLIAVGVPAYAALSVATWRGLVGPNRVRLILTWAGVTLLVVGFLVGLWALKGIGATLLVLAMFSARSETWGRV